MIQALINPLYSLKVMLVWQGKLFFGIAWLFRKLRSGRIWGPDKCQGSCKRAHQYTIWMMLLEPGTLITELLCHHCFPSRSCKNKKTKEILETFSNTASVNNLVAILLVESQQEGEQISQRKSLMQPEDSAGHTLWTRD